MGFSIMAVWYVNILLRLDAYVVCFFGTLEETSHQRIITKSILVPLSPKPWK